MAYFHRAPCRMRPFTASSLLLAGLALLGPELSRAAAADNEVREFNIKIDAKPAGSYTLSINRQDDGVTMVTGQADVKHRVLVVTYKYTYQGAEAWKDGRLLRLESTCNDDGKQHAVSVTAEPDATRVKADGHERTTRPDVWTTSYWHLADAKFRNQTVPLLDCDTGKDIVGTLQYIGTQQLNVSGQAENCAHYRVKGEQIQADLWYDSKECLVREESMEDGHRTLLELVRIRK